MKRKWAFSATLCVLLAAVPMTGAAYPPPGATELVSSSSTGSQGNFGSYTPDITPDGRFVVYHSPARNLAPGDTNETWDSFLFDRQTGQSERISIGTNGEQPDWQAVGPSVSDDGSLVLFVSASDKLIAGDTNLGVDAFLRDRVAGTTERVSLTSEGEQQNGSITGYAVISGDGSRIAFASTASNLVDGDSNGQRDVFVRDLETGEVEMVSVTDSGQAPGGTSLGVAISRNGRFVAFDTTAALVPDDTNSASDIYVRDTLLGVTERVSVPNDDDEANRSSWHPSISADGSKIVFESAATNLVANDVNGLVDEHPTIDALTLRDIFVRDRVKAETRRVSVSSTGTQTSGQAWLSTISADGSVVAFASRGSNLVEDDTNGEGTNVGFDVYVHDLETGSTERASVGSGGEQGDWGSTLPSLSGHGELVAFQSLASNLVAGDTNNDTDIFVRDRSPLRVDVAPLDDAMTVAGWVRLPGATIASGTDVAGDAEPLSGGDLVSASVIERPEDEDVLVRIGLSSIPRASTEPSGIETLPTASFAGVPGFSLAGSPVTYGVEFEGGNQRYLLGAQGLPGGAIVATLQRCDGSICATPELIEGSFGTTANEVLLSIPAASLPEGSLLGVQVRTEIGAQILDELALGDVDRAEPDVSVQVTSESGEQPVRVITPELEAGRFSLEVPVTPGIYEVSARACLASRCSEHVSSITI